MASLRSVAAPLAALAALALPVWEQAQAAPSPTPRLLRAGMAGRDVALLQDALERSHFRAASATSTGSYGAAVRAEVARVQHVYKLPVSGIYGSATREKLLWAYGKDGRAELHRLTVERARAALHERRIAGVMRAVRRSEALSSTMAYSQSGTRQTLPGYPGVPTATDCSGWATWVLRSVGVNPGKHSYVGWTGTLGVEGKLVVNASPSTMQVGDLVLYGGFPHGHVGVYIGHGIVAGHGSPGIHEVTWNADGRGVGQVRRYFS